jgi:hypothetical protein
MLAVDDIIALSCEGTIEGNRWLDGRTIDGTVGLAPNSNTLPFTGTWWRVQDGGSGSFTFRCLGHVAGNRWLDGRTIDGSAGLAPTTSTPPFSGTRWREHDLGNEIIMLECLGDIPGNRWLDGRTGDGSVGLAPSNSNPPFSGTRWRVVTALSNFTFASDISTENRNRLLERHRFAVSQITECNNLTDAEKGSLLITYRRAIHHNTLNEAGVNAQALINGSRIDVNFGVLFPNGDVEIAQTLIHEMMHCAGFTHPTRRDPPPGMSCATPNPAIFDCPFDNGQYYGTPPLRAEMCIAGEQSDLFARIQQKASEESCIIDENGEAKIHQF